MRINPDSNANTLALKGKSMCPDYQGTPNISGGTNYSKSAAISPKGTRPTSANVRVPTSAVVSHDNNIITLLKPQLMLKTNGNVIAKAYDLIPHTTPKNITKAESLYFPLESAIMEK